MWSVIVGLAMGNAHLGLIVPTTMVMALDDQGERAGLALSLGGTLQMLADGLSGVVLGPALGADPRPMIGGIAFAALGHADPDAAGASTSGGRAHRLKFTQGRIQHLQS